MVIVVFFFFKQKTAYEMRISDWSSDVCSSDLYGEPTASAKRPNTGVRPGASTAAFDSAWPRPLLSKWPTMQMPFSWARRKPGCSPLWRSSTSATSAPDRREGESQPAVPAKRSEEHTSELQSLMRNSYAVFCLQKKTQHEYHRDT